MSSEFKYIVEWENGKALVYEVVENGRRLFKTFWFTKEKDEYVKWVLSVPPEDVCFTVSKNNSENEN